MTDNELLALAAKAVNGGGWHPLTHDTPNGRNWNPLSDDGDALRLAHALRMNIEPQATMGGKPVGFNVWPSGRGDCRETQDGNDAKHLRRAIVCAAAALAA